MPRITVFNQKGGVGKTTTALNLAAALARAGEAPLAIDLDPQGHLTSLSGIGAVSGDNSMYAFFRDNKPLSEILRHTTRNWSLLPAHLELAKVDTQFGKGPNVLGYRQDIPRAFWPRCLRNAHCGKRVPGGKPVCGKRCVRACAGQPRRAGLSGLVRGTEGGRFSRHGGLAKHFGNIRLRLYRRCFFRRTADDQRDGALQISTFPTRKTIQRAAF